MGQIRIITDTASDITRQRAEELDVIVVVEEDLFGLHSETYEVPYTCEGQCKNARIFFTRRVNDASVKEEHSVLYEHALNMLRRHDVLRS